MPARFNSAAASPSANSGRAARKASTIASFSSGNTLRARPQSQACFEGFPIRDPHFDEAKASSKDLRAGASYALHHAGSLPKVAVVRVLRAWGVYSPSQQVSFESLEGRPRAWQMRGTVMYWFLAPLAIVGAFLLRRRKRLIAPLAATGQTGRTPCLRQGRCTVFVAETSRPRQIARRVSAGSITSSTCAWPAAM